MTLKILIAAAVFAVYLAEAIAPASAQTPIRATNANGEVVLVVDFEVKPGSKTEFEQFFRRSVTCSRLEPGNVAFNIHKVVDSEGSYVLYEIWRSPAALEEHFAQPYTQALFAMFDRTLVRPVTEGGLRYIADLDPAARPAPVTSNPSSQAECR
jgi:quinol monooxygenase YgiN